MTEQEIKDGAPSGAQYWVELGRFTDGSGYLVGYYRLFNSIMFVFDCGEWVKSEYGINQLKLKPL